MGDDEDNVEEVPEVVRVTIRPLSVPLTEPFTIATATMTATRAALVRVECSQGSFGLGEAACLPPVTAEDQPDVIRVLEEFAPKLVGLPLQRSPRTARAIIAGAVAPLDATPVARAGIEMALLDATARAAGLPLHALLADDRAPALHLVSDVTIPIAEKAEMVRLATKWYARGFTAFKVKVGKDVTADAERIAAIAAEVTGITFRVDANGGYSAGDAIAFFERATKAGARIECFEQPCAREDMEAMARVREAIAAPVVADESVRSLDDLTALANAKACDGVNLKVMKLGGVANAYEVGARAKALGMSLMMGGMVETRLGMTAGAHVAAALGGVDWVDLDTAFLLAEDPFRGGYRADGPKMHIYGDGLGVFEG
jgi:L-alanine-DL-glutamate epimerase-like enolase superfamily enzyme